VGNTELPGIECRLAMADVYEGVTFGAVGR
jgi:hypothetical protein